METNEERRKRITLSKAARAEERKNRLFTKHKHLASIAASLRTIARAVEDEEGWLVKAILIHATTMKQDVAKALSSIAHRPRGKKD
jgi:predicted hydrolase (HD superfamily)